MRVLITGANGFIGKNLITRMREETDFEPIAVTRETPLAELHDLLVGVDAVIHLAGENRPQDPADFEAVNVGFTQSLCDALSRTGRAIPLLFASSTQASLDNPYGKSKSGAEAAVRNLEAGTGCSARIYRLPNVFGKWCKPNYNSVVATFCHNIANGLPIHVNDPAAILRLVYVDDVVNQFFADLRNPQAVVDPPRVSPEYQMSLGELAAQIEAFRISRETLITEAVGTGLIRALYATYVSYLRPEAFTYPIPSYGDQRGVFVEMLKTHDSGQFSYFTAHPGVTRGGHYHHSKTEKFLVIKGTARFGFRHILNEAYHELETSGTVPQIVETIPGWSHDITNVGEDEMVVMLWANEIFDRARPDTLSSAVKS